MTATTRVGVGAPDDGPPGGPVDQPRDISVRVTPADKIFRALAGGVGLFSLVIVAATAFFSNSGWIKFFTGSVWNTSSGKFGVFGLLVGTVLIAVIALVVAAPIAIATAVFINEYAPKWMRSILVSAIDLLAALPSLIFGLWGLFQLQNHLVGPSRWFGHHLSAIPIFRFTSDAPSLTRSAFIAGVVVGLMIVSRRHVPGAARAV